MENLKLTNNYMELELLAVVGSNALLKRLNDNSFIVCRGLEIHNDFTCEWVMLWDTLKHTIKHSIVSMKKY